MQVLKGILSESKAYYLNIKEEIQKRLRSLPSGSIKERNISGRKYYYLQRRKENKIVHEYIGKERPDDLLKQIQERKALLAELRKANEALKLLQRAEGRKVDKYLADIFRVFHKHNLFQEGVELIGSWCFKFYQKCLGIKEYPLRTIDIDFFNSNTIARNQAHEF
jgi:hypothetical protein